MLRLWHQAGNTGPRLLVGAAALAMAACGGAATSGADVGFGAASGPAVLEAPEETEAVRVWRYTWAPDAVQVSPEAMLDARLGAFARAVERYRAVSPGSAPPVFLDSAGLEEAINREIEEVRDRADISVHIRDIPSGEVLFDYFGDQQLIPASNNKLVTAAAALALLGPRFTFDTSVFRKWDTLYLRGEGDPLLFADDLWDLVEDVSGQIDPTTIERIVVDESLFSARRFGPGYPEDGPGYAYTAPSSALSLEFNTVEVTVYAVEGSRRPAVRVSPDSDHVTVDNRARLGTKDTLSVESRARGNRLEISVRGTFPRDRPAVRVRRRVFDPALYTGETFAHMLSEIGGAAPAKVERGPVDDEAMPVGKHTSPELHEIVSEGMAYSNNFIAEQLLRALGGVITGTPGGWENGRDVVEGFWAAMGNDPTELVFENGSGFSRNGRVSTAGLVDLVDIAYRLAPDRGLVDALPVAGEEGTLKARLRNSGRRVRAKTGTLAGVSGLTGVILAEDGSDAQIAFSILINSREDARPLNADQRRRVEDAIVMWVLFYLDDFESRRGFLSFKPMWIRAQGTQAQLEQAPADAARANRAEVAAQGGPEAL